MPPPVFYGERLREAREARGYSLQQVADYLGVTKAAVSGYEKANYEPKSDNFQKLIEFLRVPGHYFTRPPLATHSSPTFYRSMSSATKRMRDAAEQKLKWLREIVNFFAQYVEMVPVQLPPCDMPADPNKISTESIERIAADLRKYWGLGEGVISNVAHLLENKGIVVARFPLESDKLDAFSMIEEGSNRPYVILASDKNNMFRSRHDAAHELGHLVLHRNVPPQILRDNVTFTTMEKQAHRFASAFLLPVGTFGSEWIGPSLESFKNIKLKWKSAISAMIMRAADLGIVSSSQKVTLMATMGRKGWRLEEPYDRDYKPELPLFFSRTCELIVGEEVMSKADVLREIAKGREDVEAILGLEGFFDDRSLSDVDEPQPILKLFNADPSTAPEPPSSQLG